MGKSCNKCNLAIFEDYGYSNYTVEGTYFRCALNKHPEGRFDRFYGTDDRLDHAKECDRFDKGTPIDMDVDTTNLGELSAEETFVWEIAEYLNPR